VLRLAEKVLPVTVAGNFDNLSIVHGHWFCDVCTVLEMNIFRDVAPPKYEKKPPRIISTEEEQAFLNWLTRKVGKWRLPFVFLDVKALTGCRIGELARTPSQNLRDGRLYFEAVTTKGRKQRAVKLPGTLFTELK
jgi:site-specific recombinase XerD